MKKSFVIEFKKLKGVTTVVPLVKDIILLKVIGGKAGCTDLEGLDVCRGFIPKASCRECHL